MPNVSAKTREHVLVWSPRRWGTGASPPRSGACLRTDPHDRPAHPLGEPVVLLQRDRGRRASAARGGLRRPAVLVRGVGERAHPWSTRTSCAAGWTGSSSSGCRSRTPRSGRWRRSASRSRVQGSGSSDHPIAGDDDVRLSVEAVRYLLSMGHRNIGHITGTPDDLRRWTPPVDRRQGWADRARGGGGRGGPALGGVRVLRHRRRQGVGAEAARARSGAHGAVRRVGRDGDGCSAGGS